MNNIVHILHLHDTLGNHLSLQRFALGHRRLVRFEIVIMISRKNVLSSIVVDRTLKAPIGIQRSSWSVVLMGVEGIMQSVVSLAII